MSTKAYAEKMKDSGGRTGKQASLALTLMGMKHGAKKKPINASKVYPK